jgi:hypothetical protein
MSGPGRRQLATKAKMPSRFIDFLVCNGITLFRCAATIFSGGFGLIRCYFFAGVLTSLVMRPHLFQSWM